MIYLFNEQNPWVASTWVLSGSTEPPACDITPAAVGPTYTAVCGRGLDSTEVPDCGAVARPEPASAIPPLLSDRIHDVFQRAARRMLVAADDGQEIAWHARSRLAAHGFGWNELAALPLGLITTRRAMFNDLRSVGYGVSEIRHSHLLSDPRLSGRIVGPICDPQGTIISFWAREPDDAPPRHLFLNRHWRRAAPLVGLETALAAATHDRHGLVVVEDPLDALLLRSHGMANVAAIAGRGSELSARCWARLAALDVTRVTLVLTNTALALDELSAARKNHRQVPQAPELFFLLPERLAPWNNPGEFVRSQGIEAFRALLEQAWRLARVGIDHDEPPELPPAPVEPVAEAPVAELPTVELPAVQLPTVELPIAEPPAVELPVVEPRVARRPQRGDCELHRCGETDCFCFD
jgi:hypothetical protein